MDSLNTPVVGNSMGISGGQDRATFGWLTPPGDHCESEETSPPMPHSQDGPKFVQSLAALSLRSERTPVPIRRFLPAAQPHSRVGRSSSDSVHPGGPSTCHCWCHRDLLTIPEAAAYLRIGRSKAYELASRFRVTDGAEGIPVIAIGDHALRVPTAQLRRWCAFGEPTPLHCGQCSSSVDLIPSA